MSKKTLIFILPTLILVGFLFSNLFISNSSLTNFLNLEIKPEKNQVATSNGTSIYHLQSITTGPKETYPLKFTSGYELELSELSQAMVEAYDENQPDSMVYLHLNRGSIKVLKTGALNKLLIISGGKEVRPENFSSKLNAPKLEDFRPAPSLVLSVSNRSENAGETKDAPEMDPKKANKKPKSRRELISYRISRSRQKMIKCLTNRMKDVGLIQGQIDIRFAIEQKGSVSGVQVMNSTIEDEKLNLCVLTIFSRLDFSKIPDLPSDPIEIIYPVVFK